MIMLATASARFMLSEGGHRKCKRSAMSGATGVNKRSNLALGLVFAMALASVLTGAGCDPCPSCQTSVAGIPTGSFSTTSSMDAQRFGHTASLLSDGTVLIAGGLAQPDTEDSTVDLAELYNPAKGEFAAGAALIQSRQSHTATLITQGKSKGLVLIAGGDDGSDALDSAELYDPVSGSFEPVTAVMSAPRTGHTATELDDQIGRVLIVGGSPAFDPASGIFLGSLSSGELFDPRSGGQFEPLPYQMHVARSGHSAALLKGGEVLITGGVDQQGLVQGTAELFQKPLAPFLPAGAMKTPRYFHCSVTLLGGTTVLIAGGIGASQNLLASAEIYDRSRNSFTPISPMNEARQSPAATLLSNGQVVIAGGSDDDSAELYDPNTGTFTLLTSTGTQRRSGTATALIGGDVLLAGGFQLVENSGKLDLEPTMPEGELLDPATASFTATADMGEMMMPRAYHTATLLDSGSVLIAGGRSLMQVGAVLGSAEIYDRQSQSFASLPMMQQARFLHTATSLCADTACPVLLAGGLDPDGLSIGNAELYEPGPGTLSFTSGSLTDSRYAATATLLTSGQVLIAGGEHMPVAGSNLVLLQSTELYDPDAQTFTCVNGASGNPPECAASLNLARAFHTATLLPQDGGRVLIAGGTTSAGPTQSAEIFDPMLGTFLPTGSLNQPRSGHSATYMDSGPLAGKVLIAGGTNDLSAEIYDSIKGTFTATTGSMNAIHVFHTATLLTNGRVLIAGGGPGDLGDLITGMFEAQPTAEIFDPATQTFVLVGRGMLSERAAQTATLLKTGQVLITGGAAIDSVQGGAELFTPADPAAICPVCTR